MQMLLAAKLTSKLGMHYVDGLFVRFFSIEGLDWFTFHSRSSSDVGFYDQRSDTFDKDVDVSMGESGGASLNWRLIGYSGDLNGNGSTPGARGGGA